MWGPLRPRGGGGGGAPPGPAKRRRPPRTLRFPATLQVPHPISLPQPAIPQKPFGNRQRRFPRPSHSQPLEKHPLHPSHPRERPTPLPPHTSAPQLLRGLGAEPPPAGVQGRGRPWPCGANTTKYLPPNPYRNLRLRPPAYERGGFFAEKIIPTDLLWILDKGKRVC